jgi:hypothetical protein
MSHFFEDGPRRCNRNGLNDEDPMRVIGGEGGILGLPNNFRET